MVNCIYGGPALGATQMLYNGGSPHMYFGWMGGQKGLDSEPWQVVPHSEPANGQAYLLLWVIGTTTTHFYFLSWGPRRVTYLQPCINKNNRFGNSLRSLMAIYTFLNPRACRARG